jgi:putative phage-type endonuclease
VRIIDLEQGSEGWLLWRRAGLGSSDAAVLVLGESWGKTPQDLLKEKAGLERRGDHQSPSMSFGKRMEPRIRKWYEELMGFESPPLCCLHDQHDFLKASLDGWHPAGIILEIKCANRRDHQDALDGFVPEKYVPQVDHQLLVTGGKVVHYVSYHSRMDVGERYTLVTHHRDEGRLAELLTLETEFWVSVQANTACNP